MLITAGETVNVKVDVVQGDITQLSVDVVVNAANSRLVGGGGVDGAIHRAAGPELLEACRKFDGCPVGEVRDTSAYALPATRVFHTVGPVWQGGMSGEPELLVNCYRNCLTLALDLKVKSIAFPAISCGVYGYPADKAALTVVNSLHAFDKEYPSQLRVYYAVLALIWPIDIAGCRIRGKSSTRFQLLLGHTAMLSIAHICGKA